MAPLVGYNHKAILILSIIQLSCGVLFILFAGIQIGIRPRSRVTGYGMCAGFLSLIPGILGIISWKYKNNLCIIHCHMYMSILACIYGWTSLGLAAATVSINNVYFAYDRSESAPLALLIISLLEIVVSIVSSAFYCKAVCCGTRSNHNGCFQSTTMQYELSSVGQPGQQDVVLVACTYRQQGNVMQPGNQPAYQIQGTVPQGNQIVYNQGQPAPQGQIAYHAQAVPQEHIAYNVQTVPQGQNIIPTQNTTPVLPPACTALGHTQTQDEHSYDDMQMIDPAATNGANING